MGATARRLVLIATAALAFIGAGAAWVIADQLPALGAGLLLHPARRTVGAPPPSPCEETTFQGEGVTLAGWHCSAQSERRGTLVYLHGVADNRGSARRVVERFTARGFDVVAYDSRAHGRSTGDVCTYGFYEKRDLHRVLDAVRPGPVVLMGGSLGAAIALQAAAGEPRVTAVVAAETFSDLRTIAVERAPFFFSTEAIRAGLALAEQQGRFAVDEVSPVKAAATLTIPVLLIHGDADTDTPPDHSRRVMAALAGPKRLVLVPGAGHNESLREEIWAEAARWIDTQVDGVAAQHDAR